VAGGGATLADLSSRNGTFRNGERVHAEAPGRPLRPGDLVRCGDTALVVAGPAQRPRPLSAHEDTHTAER
jgi:pSer/pThr/pTyr-binding forkhead associated (FHA) protein